MFHRCFSSLRRDARKENLERATSNRLKRARAIKRMPKSSETKCRKNWAKYDRSTSISTWFQKVLLSWAEKASMIITPHASYNQLSLSSNQNPPPNRLRLPNTIAKCSRIIWRTHLSYRLTPQRKATKAPLSKSTAALGHFRSRRPLTLRTSPSMSSGLKLSKGLWHRIQFSQETEQ